MRTLLLVFFLSFCGVLAPAPLTAQSAPQTSDPIRVFVQPLQGPDADLDKSIRVKLIDRFHNDGISVVESPDNADAILSGSGLMQTNKSLSVGHRPSLCIRAGMRLVNKNGVALWAQDVSSARYAVSESASFVDKVTKGVAAAVAEESKRRASEPAPQK